MSFPALLMILMGVACSSKEPLSPVLASVNGEVVTLAEFRQALDNQLWKYGEGVAFSDKKYQAIGQEVLEALLRHKLLLQAAEKKKIAISNSDLEKHLSIYQDRYADLKEFEKFLQSHGETFEEFQHQRLEYLKINELFKIITSEVAPLTPEDLKTHYKNQKEKFRFPEQVHARQIVTDTLEKANALREMLQKKVSFKELAEKYSLTPDRAKGGDLSWFSRGVMPEEFDAICFKLPVGKLSDVIKTRYGYHIFEVLEKRGPGFFPFAEVKNKIRQELIDAHGQKAFSKWYEALWSSADIKVQQELLAKEK